MPIEIVLSESRGVTKTSWLDSKHSFSFGEYYDSKRMHFGALRVLNEDVVAPSGGFPLHSHDNMEIITIVLEGALEHRDSMQNHGIIKAGDVQRMSAGKGVKHSEYNASDKEAVHFLQIWIVPSERNIEPSYEQKTFSAQITGRFFPIASSKKNSDMIFLHQDAELQLGHFEEGTDFSFSLSKGKKLFVFVIKGTLSLSDNDLKSGDAAQVEDEASLSLHFKSKTYLLAIIL